MPEGDDSAAMRCSPAVALLETAAYRGEPINLERRKVRAARKKF
jgi:hypothetical protein